MKIEIIFAFLCSLLIAAASKPHSDRSYEKDLSDVDHHEDTDEHDPNYDHEAFLGKDEAKRFDELTPEESKEKLGLIYDKIDADKDGKVSEAELKDWITKTSKRYLIEDRDRQWKELNLNAEDKLAWADYKKHSYGDDSDDTSTQQQVARDEKRWGAADKDGDKSLNKEEFLDFIHPEEAPHMKKIVVEDSLSKMDIEKDGKISLDEYMNDVYGEEYKKLMTTKKELTDDMKREQEYFTKKYDSNKDGFLSDSEVDMFVLGDDVVTLAAKEAKHLIDQADEDKDMWHPDEDEEKPDWVKEEEQSFKETRDKDKDGFLNFDEVSDWIIPQDYDHVESETKHLFAQADVDNDKFLTKEEVLNKHDIFVGSQATDFGEALTRHEEL